eukprot:TRINITY_DN10886_c0_g1_i1.p1 TRINITY_DN10886_c0_g1~~TRINITY_DN10886_c0_g1_i1.p1  ORF type:complete len:209 (-),score=67.12 TRINITY_DN10886_c0_g1_i1:163-789(-)
MSRCRAANAGGNLRGDALKSRLLAQADAAFACANDDYGLRREMLKQPASREERWNQVDKGAQMLLARPAVEPKMLPDAEEIDVEALRQAAEHGDLKALAKMDKRLQKLLDPDQCNQVLEEGDLVDEEARQALQLYRSTFMSLEANGKDREKEAFQAVARDDSDALKVRLDRGVRPTCMNAGGYTLLALARERQSEACIRILLEAGATD